MYIRLSLIDVKELEKAIYESEPVNFIRSYLNTLRRETMENNEIIELCQQIYAEHKEALDLIFENRPDRLQNVSEFFKEWFFRILINIKIIT